MSLPPLESIEPRAVSPDQVREELARLIASRGLKDSHQLRTLLEYLVQETLEGRHEGLKEYSLGRQVFHRPDHYDPRTDAIVRVQASLLRKKIEQFYSSEGAANPFRITLPRGRYVPEFSIAAEALPELEVPPPEELPQPERRRWLRELGFAVGGLALGAGAAWRWSVSNQVHRKIPAEPTDCPELWNAFFSPGKPAIVSFGVPLFYIVGPGLYMRDVQLNKPEQTQGTQLHAFAEKLKLSPYPQEDVYTGIGEFLGLQKVSTFLSERGVNAEVANSHYLAPSALRGKNLVVISSMRFQTMLADRKFPKAFDLVMTTEGGIRNLNPRAGEKDIYEPTGSSSGVSTSYALVSLWPGEGPGERILALTGINTWATQAAAEFVINPNHLRNLTRRLAQDPERSKSPYFQVVLRAEGKNNILQGVELITHRFVG